MIIARGNRSRIHAASATSAPRALVGGRTPSPLSGQLGRWRPTSFRPSRIAIPRPGLDALVTLLLLALAASAFIPGARFEMHTAADQTAVETTATLISTLAAVLFCDRFWRHLRLRDLLLGGGLAVIAVSNLGTDVLLAGNLQLAGHSAAWVVLGGRLMGWLLIAGAAIAPDRSIGRPSSAAVRRLCLRAVPIVGLMILAFALSTHATSYEATHDGPLGDPTAMLVAQILLALLTGLAAIAFRREARDGSDPTARLLALACTFAAAATLANCADPTFYASRVGIGDVLRLGWLIALFACVCVEWSLDERRAPVHALARERRRMAADVHDLIMQDLSFALANARTLVDDPARGPQASTVVLAGERALAGARDVISGLTEKKSSQPIIEAIEASVRAAARHTRLRFDATGASTSAPPDQPTREALVHIAREAVTNAVKHAGASSIEVVIAHPDEWRLTVRDDGRGLDPAHGGDGVALGPENFGLASMHRHAQALGGTLCVGPADGGGTIVEASLP
jgi:signal transduction histidine kinase